MKSFIVAGLFVLCGLYFSGCKTTGATDTAVAEYKCPSCQETIKYRYHPTKPWITTGQEVVHVCPDCKKTWGSNLNATTTCEMCADTHAKWMRPEAGINLSHFAEDTGKSTKALHPKANPRCFD